MGLAVMIVGGGSGSAEPPHDGGSDMTDEVIVRAVRRHGNGYSSDEILCRDDVRRRITQAIASSQGLDVSPESADPFEQTWLRRMVRLRKQARWPVKTTRRGSPVPDDVYPIAEMAARTVMDRRRITSDEVLMSPSAARELDAEANRQRGGVDPVAVRKAVLNLRKRRSLKPELVLTVADWPRTVTTHSYADIADQVDRGVLPNDPGVYLFRGPEGYVYVGETNHLSRRLTSHLTDSDRDRLAEYLANHADTTTVEIHRFPADSPGGKTAARRAYESELIRSRRPTLNLRP